MPLPHARCLHGLDPYSGRSESGAGGEALPIVENNIPMPEGRLSDTCLWAKMRGLLKGMKDGQSFVWHENNMIYRAAKQAGIEIKTRKVNGTGYRVWRVRKQPPTNH